MRCALVILVLATACAPSPVPDAPEPARPTQPVAVQVVVSGEVYQVFDVGNATEVSIWLGDGSCNPLEMVGRTFANAEGKFELPITQGLQAAQERCVIAEATGGAARGRTNMRVTPTASGDPAHFTMVIRMDPPPPLTRADADNLAAALRAVVNENSESAMPTLASHVIAQDIDSVRVGIEHLRTWLGDIASTTLTDERRAQNFHEYVYDVAGSKGTRTTFRIQQGPRRAAFTPLLQLGSRASRYVSTFARLVTANDAEKLARFLTADDVDYPVEKARAVMQRYKTLEGIETARPVFVSIDEEKSALRYVIEGRKKDGSEVSVPIAIGYGDGMLWIRE